MNNNNLQGDCQSVKVGRIYSLKNKLNGKRYVGQTIQKISKRINQHMRANTVIGCALRKHGKDNFEIEIIEDNVAIEDLDALETYFIVYFDCIAPKGYNLNYGGNGRGIVLEETRKKLSEASKGHFVSEETREKQRKANLGRKNWQFGKPVSEETRKKISKALTGRKRPDMAGENNPMYGVHLTGEKNPMFGKKGGKSPFLGHHHTEEIKKAISEKMRGNKNGAGNKNKIKPRHKH